MKQTSILKYALALLPLLGSLYATADAPKPEQVIKWRQSTFQTVAWETGRIKASLDGQFNKDEVSKAAAAISAIANSGLSGLFAPGSDTGKGFHDTSISADAFSNTPHLAELAGNFAKEAAELNRIAAAGDQSGIKDQFGRLTKTCKACHDDFKRKD